MTILTPEQDKALTKAMRKHYDGLPPQPFPYATNEVAAFLAGIEYAQENRERAIAQKDEPRWITALRWWTK